MNDIYSVKDKLPEKMGHYLAYCPQSFPKNCRWVVAEFYIDGDFKGWYDEYDSCLKDVTHWSELPQEPKLKQ